MNTVNMIFPPELMLESDALPGGGGVRNVERWARETIQSLLEQKPLGKSINQAQGPLDRMVPSDHGESLWGHGADGACLSEQLRKVWRAI